MLGVEKVGELGVGVRVGAAHEAVADESDADWFFHDGERILVSLIGNVEPMLFRLSVFPPKGKGKVRKFPKAVSMRRKRGGCRFCR